MNFVRASLPEFASDAIIVNPAAWPRNGSSTALIKKAKFCDGDHIAFT